MKKLSCKLGDQFGNWIVVDNNIFTKNGHTYVKVQCKCGKIEDKCLSDLVNGRTKSCRSCAAHSRGKQIKIGDKYKHWTVIGNPKISECQNVLWECQCDCGTIRWIQGSELTNPNKCFQCQKCAAIKRGDLQAKKNGKIGDLTLTRYTKLKRSAEIRNIKFEVSIEYLWNLFESQKQICAITGDYIKSINEASLDRIDSNSDYTENNVQWVTYQANISKHTMTMNELYEFCKKVLNHANQQPSQPLTKLEGSETND
jgi:hypothetical protein